MAGKTFYTRNAVKASKASNSFRPRGNSNDLPGLAYIQGHSIRNIFMPRALLPVVGRDGYKTIFTSRVEGGSSNRTVFQVEDSKENDYFVDSDSLERARFIVSNETIPVITLENYSDHILGIVYPNGDSSNLADLNQGVIFELISQLVNRLANFFDVIKIPNNLLGKSDFHGYETISFKFATKTTAKITFPNGGLLQVPNFQLMPQVYGADGEHSKTTPYTDLMKFDVIAWIENSGPPGMYPDVTPSNSYKGSLFNGIIEPFKIRTEIYDLDTFAKTDEVKPNSLSGKVMQKIMGYSLHSENLNGGISPVQDNGNYAIADSKLNGDIFVKETTLSPDPFVEKDNLTHRYFDEEIQNLTGFDRLNPGILPFDAIAASTGYTARSFDRSSSINYRGRLR